MKKTIKQLLFSVLISCIALLSHAQQKTVTGTVTDDQGKPLAGISFLIKGTTQGGITNEDGSFSIRATNNSVLEFSGVGYKAQQIKVGNSSTFTVVMQKSENQMEEVVVTAMGITKQQRALGYSATTVKSAELVKTAPVNFASALYGKVPGLQISSGPGGSTAGVVMQVRGLNSINFSSTPLVVVDGVPVRDGAFNSGNYWGDQRIRANGITDLNNEDMENVTVLKGAAAAALYGDEGKNGVILITTKKAKNKGFAVDASVMYFQDKAAYLPRFQEVRGAGFPVPWNVYSSDANGFAHYTLNGVDYRTTVQGSLNFGPLFDGKPILTWDGKVRPYSAQPDRYDALFQTAQNTVQNVAVSSGTDKAKIRLSLTHQSYEGVSLGSKDGRLNANLNTTVNFSPKFSIDLIINYMNQNIHNRPWQLDRLVNNFGGMMPTFDNGAWYKEKYQTSLGYRYVTGSNNSLTPSENLKIPNIRTDILDYMWSVNKNAVDEYNNRLLTNFTANLEIINNLRLRGKIATDMTFDRTVNKTASSQPISYGPSGYFGLSTYNDNILYGDLMLEYNRDITKDLNANARVGYTARKEGILTSSVGTNGGLTTENRFDLSSSALTPYGSGGSFYPYKLIKDGLFGVLNLNYKGYLYAEGTLRRDRTSTMNPQSNTGLYPSVSAGFILSDAITLPQAISYAKLRASWGIVATYPEPYVANVAYNLGNLGVQSSGSSAVLTNTIKTGPFGNETIKPEKKNEVEVGLEAKFLKNRMGIDMAYYAAKVNDLLLNQSLPISMGAGSILTNIGIVTNHGFELALNANPVDLKNFKWSFTFNFATNKNKIVQLANGSSELIHADNDGNAYQVKSVVGQPVGDIYVHPVLKDAQGRNIISSDGLYQADPNKMVSGGNAQAKGAGGFLNSLNYKNFGLDFVIDYRYGGYVIPTGLFWMTSRGLTKESLNYMDAAHGGLTYYLDKNTGKGIQTTASAGPNGEVVMHDGMLLDGVTADGNKNTNVVSQAYYYWVTYNWGGPQYSPTTLYSLYVQKNNYVKMREIALNYSLPRRISQKVWASKIVVSVFARNPFFLYRTIKDMDPEQLTTGNVWYMNLNNAGSGVATRSYGASIRLTF